MMMMMLEFTIVVFDCPSPHYIVQALRDGTPQV